MHNNSRRFAFLRRTFTVPFLVVFLCCAAQASDGKFINTLRPFPAALSPLLPYDVDAHLIARLMSNVHPTDGSQYSAHDAQLVMVAQREFDILAWQAFLALNWPQRKYGDPQSTINDPSAEPLWAYWVPVQDVFLPNGAAPKYPWDPDRAARESGKVALDMHKAAWRQDASASDNFQAFSGPLVDQNGKWVRYEALIDPEEYAYIYENRLYSLDGQVAFSERDVDRNGVDFPVNDGTRKHGSIEIKLAWKELGKNDDPSRFYTKRILVTISGPSTGGPPKTREILAGLVGMHIAMRTESSPEWIWSTFEQIDNVRQNPLPGGRLSHASLMNPLSHATPNLLPPTNAGCKAGTCTTWYEDETNTPTQVTRVTVPTQAGLNPLDARLTTEAMALNAQVQAILRANHSVFQYYELIGTQWPVHPYAPAVPGGQGSAPESITNKTPGEIVPVFLVNTTMETYFQKGAQAAGCLEQDDRIDNCKQDSTPVIGTESCAGCHYSAGICIGFKRNVDGTPHLVNGLKVPVYGENSNFGRNGNGLFSWTLQIETAKQNVGPGASSNTLPVARKGPAGQ
jgi:hypothetical protein